MQIPLFWKPVKEGYFLSSGLIEVGGRRGGGASLTYVGGNSWWVQFKSRQRFWSWIIESRFDEENSEHHVVVNFYLSFVLYRVKFSFK